MARKRQRWWAPRTRVRNVPYAERMCEAIDTPISLGVYLRLKYGEFDQLAEMSVDPLHYLSHDRFFLDTQAVSILRKWENLPTTFDRERSAIEKFLRSEADCHSTNERLLDAAKRRDAERQLSPLACEAYHLARRKIAAILGDVPWLSELPFRFGPGAAFGVRGDTSHHKKLHSVPECTFAMMPILGTFLTEFPSWFPEGSQPVDLVEGSDLTFVPKNAKTHRTICIEPLLNGLYQKGVGSYLRDRLKRWGVNLNDQGVNQRLAGEAYHSRLATIDFESASDTISYALVLDLLPIDWFEFLDVARCPYFRVDGNWYNFSKFSSMGNAYTFELETLLFFALAISCCEVQGVPYSVQGNLHVYGDDVIIPTEAFDLFSEVSSHAGFSVNREKSFATGPFYESCGRDYFEGHDVRPFFLKKDIVTLGDLYYVANFTNAIADQVSGFATALDGDHPRRAERLRALHAWVVGGIPARHRNLVPRGQGDCGLVADFDVARPSRSRRHKRQQWDCHDFARVRECAVRSTLSESDTLTSAYSTYGLAARYDPTEDEILITYLETGKVKEINADLPAMQRWRVIPTVEPDEPLDNGSGYTRRKRTRWVRDSGSIAFGSWPEAPIWGDASLRLVNRAKR